MGVRVYLWHRLFQITVYFVTIPLYFQFVVVLNFQLAANVEKQKQKYCWLLIKNVHHFVLFNDQFVCGGKVALFIKVNGFCYHVSWFETDLFNDKSIWWLLVAWLVWWLSVCFSCHFQWQVLSIGANIIFGFFYSLKWSWSVWIDIIFKSDFILFDNPEESTVTVKFVNNFFSVKKYYFSSFPQYQQH